MRKMRNRLTLLTAVLEQLDGEFQTLRELWENDEEGACKADIACFANTIDAFLRAIVKAEHGDELADLIERLKVMKEANRCLVWSSGYTNLEYVIGKLEGK